MGLALRETHPDTAIVLLDAAMAAYARAGDAMHVNNARYMMASAAAAAGRRTTEATAWTDACAAYARERGNRHELAHAALIRAGLTVDEPIMPLVDAVEEFRTAGDLRCLTRSLMLLAGRRPVHDRPALFRQAYEVAVRAKDAGHQAAALEGLVRALWETGARRLAVVELGVLTHVVGEKEALARCPASMLAELDRWDTTLAEGQARGALHAAPPVT
jgi:hypothetical protein